MSEDMPYVKNQVKDIFSVSDEEVEEQMKHPEIIAGYLFEFMKKKCI